ncbi:MAG: HlyD family efflux transporter periplasmic adaptor subunit [Candidatus Pacebacteria bacterium]|nr:HlyD family efflux transporter periplasmic adaptor subunit [Candidatus Paceibacterota bacterium]
MNKHIEKIVKYTQAIFYEWVRFHKELPFRKKLFLILGEVLLIAGFFFLATSSVSTTVETEPLPRKVKVSPLSALSDNEKGLPLIGSVTSVSEATIRSETSGKLNRVYKKLGDQVYAGQIIAEFENSAERAALLQAEGAYEQAKASRDITRLNSTQSGSSLLDTKNQALNTIYSSYTTLDDAIRGKTDVAYSDARFESIKLLLSISDAQLTFSLETKRKAIEQMLLARDTRNKVLTVNDDLMAELTVVQSEVQLVKSYLDDLFSAYSKALQNGAQTQTSLDAGKVITQTARQSVGATLSGVIGARSSLSSSITAKEVAGSVTTEAAGSLATSEAQIKQALGSYNAALSRLQKTVLRSPITGTINSLSIDTGDYISAFTQVAVISNNKALEIVSSVTEDDASRITIGTKVIINSSIEGVVTRVASALDPVTKKIEVRIGIKELQSNLINGQSVRLTISKDISKKTEVKTQARSEPILIPLSSLKLTPQGANIFIVSTTSTLISVKVKEGALLGDQIQILEGLYGDESIVVDARGLKEGMSVIVTE